MSKNPNKFMLHRIRKYPENPPEKRYQVFTTEHKTSKEAKEWLVKDALNYDMVLIYRQPYTVVEDHWYFKVRKEKDPDEG